MIRYAVRTDVDRMTGKVIAVYFQMRTGKTAKSKVLEDGLIVADYNSRGSLLGVELLGPCTGKVLDKIQIDSPAREFIRRAAPRELMPV